MVDLKARSRPGEAFEFVMDSNETTGFVWSVESDGGTRCSLRYEPDDNPEFLDGVGGQEVVGITADSPGKRTIVLLSSRSPDEIGRRYVIELVTVPDPEMRYEKAAVGCRRTLVLESEGWEVIDSGELDWTMSIVDGRTEISVKASQEGTHSLTVVRGRSDAVEFLITAKEPETRIELETEVGKPASFHLYSNPTTGFEWTVTDDGGLEYESRYVAAINRPGICGAGGRQEVTLVARSPGTYAFLMSYCRRWEGEPVPDCKVVLTARPPS